MTKGRGATEEGGVKDEPAWLDAALDLRPFLKLAPRLTVKSGVREA